LLAELCSPATLVRLLITGLDGQHLWFLPALGVTGVLFALAKSRFGWGAVLALALLFYVLALAVRPYRGLLGLPRPPLNMRNGPFFGITLHHRRRVDPRATSGQGSSPAPAPALFALAAALLLGEVAVLHAQATIPFRASPTIR
jgi:hypothetical protein